MVTTPRLRALLLMAALCSAACRPSIEGRASLVDRDVVLAVRSLPVEAKPDAPVAYEALFVGPDGPADAKTLDWASCSARKPLAASGSVALACFEPSGAALTALGAGAMVTGKVAKDACQLFGPTPPPPMKGEPNGRPADADTTGGYYQPVRVRLHAPGEPDAYSVGTTRLICGLGGATQEQASDYGKRYHLNENPALDSVVLRRSGHDEALPLQSASMSTVQVRASEHVTLRASWATCPTKAKCGDGICGGSEDAMSCSNDCGVPVPKGCTGSEPYVAFDTVQREIAERREAIRISWYANDGSFEHDRTGSSEADAAIVVSENEWTAPNTTGDVLLWVVIRDDRGGVGWQSYKLAVHR
jgi:hypothetical protein